MWSHLLLKRVNFFFLIVKCKKQLAAFASFREIIKIFSALYSHTEFIHTQNAQLTFCILALLFLK